jgi:para-nitrobenzyl esterase
LVFTLAVFAPAALVAEPVRVTTDSGVLIGSTSEFGAIFKGVPFAAPPVGDLRWAPPKPVAAQSNDRPAADYGANCAQKLSANGVPNAGGAVGPISEDCLYLNVWTPRRAPKAPVMVWLHGGANLMGAGSLGAYEGGAFSRDGVILVTINYRLGAFGFFAHPALTRAAGADEPLINYGLMDQIEALRWVKRNIAAFGGDPDNVTLFGESAGAQDTLLLMTAPSAQGLFAKAIVESAPAWAALQTLSKREAQDDALIRSAGAPPNATLAQLRAIPMAKLIELNSFRGGPAIDGRLILEATAEAFSYGHYDHVPLIIGSNSFEASLMMTLGIQPAAALAATPPSLKTAYADIADDKARAEVLFTDGVMGAPARWIAAKASRSPSYLYHFAYVPEAERGKVTGAGHAAEIPFVFESWGSLGAIGGGLNPTPADLAMTNQLHGCWISFAKSGAPVCPGGPAWPGYRSKDDQLMVFDIDTKVEDHFRKAHYDAQEASQLKTEGVKP